MGMKLGRVVSLAEVHGRYLVPAEEAEHVEGKVDVVELVRLPGPGVAHHPGRPYDDRRQAVPHSPAHLDLAPELGHEVVVDEILSGVQLVLGDQPLPLGVHHHRAEVDQEGEAAAGLAEIDDVPHAPVVYLAGDPLGDEEVEGAREMPDLAGPGGEGFVTVRAQAQVGIGDVADDGAQAAPLGLAVPLQLGDVLGGAAHELLLDQEDELHVRVVRKDAPYLPAPDETGVAGEEYLPGGHRRCSLHPCARRRPRVIVINSVPSLTGASRILKTNMYDHVLSCRP